MHWLKPNLASEVVNSKTVSDAALWKEKLKNGGGLWGKATAMFLKTRSLHKCFCVCQKLMITMYITVWGANNNGCSDLSIIKYFLLDK